MGAVILLDACCLEYIYLFVSYQLPNLSQHVMLKVFYMCTSEIFFPSLKETEVTCNQKMKYFTTNRTQWSHVNDFQDVVIPKIDAS
jgi:hypothetical protein